MSNPISYNPFLGWVDATDPNNLPVDVRIIGASDLLRYENFGVAATSKINAESVRVDDALVRITGTENSITGLNTSVGGLNTSVGGLNTRITAIEATPAVFFRKTADTSRSATTTLAEDPHLKLDLGPNELIEVKAVLFVTGVTAADIKFAFAGTGVTLGRWGRDNFAATTSANPGATPTAIAYDTTGVMQTIVLEGLLQAPAGGGHVGLMWAQSTSNAGTTTVHQHSYLKSHTLSGG